ncbi:hypothetical protein, partial [Hydrogenophaga sp.]|uniref:hypothetical protein n=1 Tax=Hydrogenophaga sp. TaxID=1904254 RepID=UPI00273416FA
APRLEGLPADLAVHGRRHRGVPQTDGAGLMSVPLIGAIVGLLIALADFAALRLLAGRVDLPETKAVLTVTGIIQLLLLPIVGWFVAPYFFGE